MERAYSNEHRNEEEEFDPVVEVRCDHRSSYSSTRVNEYRLKSCICLCILSITTTCYSNLIKACRLTNYSVVGRRINNNCEGVKGDHNPL